jgi:hypothetical protein
MSYRSLEHDRIAQRLPALWRAVDPVRFSLRADRGSVSGDRLLVLFEYLHEVAD